MLREGPTEPMTQRDTTLSLPGGARAAQIIQAQVDAQETMTTLADQLLVLFDEIPPAGLIHQHHQTMRQHVQTYFRIADGVWEALATDRLSELTSNPGYNVVADALEQKLIQIHESCQRADQHPKARGSWLWRRRVHHYGQSLLEWKRCIDTSGGALPDATACGRTLYRAHGRVGLASINGFSYLLVISLPVLGILTSLLLACLFGAINVLIPTTLPKSLAPTVIAGLSVLTILWFSTPGSASLPLIAGYALNRRQTMLFSRTLRSTINVKTSPGLLGIILRILLTTLGTVFCIALVGLLVVSALVTRAFFADTHTSTVQDIGGYMISLTQNTLGQTLPIDPLLFTLLLPAIGLLMITIFFLPCTLVVQARLVRGLIGHSTHSPEARRYALRPAQDLLSFHTITLLFAAILANSVYNFGTDSVLPSDWPLLSQRLLIFLGALILPFVLLIDLPFRQGIARWRAAKLRDLAQRRTEIAQRLSRSQLQATDQADLRTLQDYMTWQYHRTQEDEVKAVSPAPLSIARGLLALILALLGGIALDQISQVLHSLVQR